MDLLNRGWRSTKQLFTLGDSSHKHDSVNQSSSYIASEEKRSLDRIASRENMRPERAVHGGKARQDGSLEEDEVVRQTIGGHEVERHKIVTERLTTVSSLSDSDAMSETEELHIPDYETAIFALG